MFPLLLLVPMIIAMFWMQNKQQKKQKELEDSLKTGDRVVTQSGLIGKLTDKGNRYVKVEIAPGIKVQMLRTAVVARDTGEETPDKKADDAKADTKSDEKSGKSSSAKSDDKARAKSESASK
jgi:preprotein translocase subunit YajC